MLYQHPQIFQYQIYSLSIIEFIGSSSNQVQHFLQTFIVFDVIQHYNKTQHVL